MSGRIANHLTTCAADPNTFVRRRVVVTLYTFFLWAVRWRLIVSPPFVRVCMCVRVRVCECACVRMRLLVCMMLASLVDVCSGFFFIFEYMLRGRSELSHIDGRPTYVRPHCLAFLICRRVYSRFAYFMCRARSGHTSCI